MLNTGNKKIVFGKLWNWRIDEWLYEELKKSEEKSRKLMYAVASYT